MRFKGNEILVIVNDTYDENIFIKKSVKQAEESSLLCFKISSLKKKTLF